MDLSNCNNDDIKTGNNDNIGMKLTYYIFNDFPLSLCPNFGKIVGAYCFRFVRASVRPCVRSKFY